MRVFKSLRWGWVGCQRELGEFDTKMAISDLVAAIRAVKADSEGLKLQKQFFEEATHPLDTKQ
jgi:hypothetical protein